MTTAVGPQLRNARAQQVVKLRTAASFHTPLAPLFAAAADAVASLNDPGMPVTQPEQWRWSATVVEALKLADRVIGGDL